MKSATSLTPPSTDLSLVNFQHLKVLESMITEDQKKHNNTEVNYVTTYKSCFLLLPFSNGTVYLCFCYKKGGIWRCIYHNIYVSIIFNHYRDIDFEILDKTTRNPELFWTFWLDVIEILDEPAKNPKLFLSNISQWDPFILYPMNRLQFL
jgi:hypothetical protein